MKADRRQSLARAATVAVAGAVLALASAPAAFAASDSKPQPRSTASTRTTTTSKTTGRGHRTTTHHGARTTKGGKPGATSTPLSPRTATAPSTTAPAAQPAAVNPSWVEPAAPGTPAAAAAHSAASGATPAPAPTHDSTWQRDTDTQHADRGVVRAFASDLKQAGQSAGFPALLVAVMVVFLLVQHRLDRRDVKLSHADWVSDQGLEFSAPATTTQH